MFDALKFIGAAICADLRKPNRAPETESDRLAPGPIISDCRDGRGGGRGRLPLSPSEQNPQVPLASEDAFAQVPGNAETVVGNGAAAGGGLHRGLHGGGEMPGHSLSRPGSRPAAAEFPRVHNARLTDDLLSGRAFEDGNHAPRWASESPKCERYGRHAFICETEVEP